jgi:dTDP-4-dehydrorhamnose reductase
MTVDRNPGEMKILIIGAGGRLGSALLRRYQAEFDVRGFAHSEIDLCDFDEVEELLKPLPFDVLINCAAMTNVDLCEEQRDQAFEINASAPELLANICEDKGAKLIHFSTDYVFDGRKTTPYLEDDAAEPLSVYGESKREGEENVLFVNERNLVIRVSWVFGPDRPSFVDNMITRAKETPEVSAVTDKFSAPTYAEDIAAMLPSFFGNDIGGLLHFCNGGQCSWKEYAEYALKVCAAEGVSLKTTEVAPLKLSEMQNFVAQRPVYTVLSTARFAEITGSAPRSWREALSEYIQKHYVKK